MLMHSIFHEIFGWESKLFIDESGFNLYLRRKYGRAPRGQVIQVLVPKRGTDVSSISAISGSEIIHCKRVTGAVNAKTFKNFMI